MKTLIIYYSKTGFTKRYAEWIAEDLNAELVPFEKRNSITLNNYDTIIYGGGFHAGVINGIDWFKEQIPTLDGKKLIVFATGASPINSEEVHKALEQNFNDLEWEKIKVFYFQSGLNYEKMGLMDKFMMSIYKFILKRKAADSVTYKMVQKSFDMSSRKDIEPLVVNAKAENRDLIV